MPSSGHMKLNLRRIETDFESLKDLLCYVGKNFISPILQCHYILLFQLILNSLNCHSILNELTKENICWNCIIIEGLHRNEVGRKF